MNCKKVKSFSLFLGVWDEIFKRTVISSGTERIKTLKEGDNIKKRLRWSSECEEERKPRLENVRVMHSGGLSRGRE